MTESVAIKGRATAADGLTAGRSAVRAGGWHPVALLGVLALWLATVGNGPLWLAVVRQLREGGGAVVGPVLLWGAALAALNLALLAWTVWPRWRRPAGIVLLALVALPSHFMLSYGVVIDPSMAANVLHTDAREAGDLIGPTLLAVVVLGVVLPGWWWWRQPVRAVAWRRLLVQQLGVGAVALGVAVALLWVGFSDLAPLMRNHKALRYMINPYNTVYAFTRQAIGERSRAAQPLQPIGEDVVPAAAAANESEAPLVVLGVGETARAANWGLGGYTRQTTPRLAALRERGDLTYFENTTSCGTNTETSVPCLFSARGRADYDGARHEESLLDVLQRAGLAVVWLDNQSGCKGVCDRVPHVKTDTLAVPGLCDGGECHDEVLLRELPGQIAQLDPERRRRGTVAVLHQMGSHGPAYHKRVPSAFRRYTPVCESAQLTACERQAVVNAYDNTIAYTDHVLAETIAWLAAQPRPAALLYVSDHGESLGENGLYLHGMPYALAPAEQTHVPMLMWFNDRMRERLALDGACLRQRAAQPASHDHWFHTVLGLFDLRTRVYDPALDVLRGCRAARAGVG